MIIYKIKINQQFVENIQLLHKHNKRQQYKSNKIIFRLKISQGYLLAIYIAYNSHLRMIFCIDLSKHLYLASFQLGNCIKVFLRKHLVNFEIPQQNKESKRNRKNLLISQKNQIYLIINQQNYNIKNQMPRTHRTLYGSRSVSYKANKNRGFAKINDKNSHHSNRIDNIYSNEINFTKFNCKLKRTAKGANSIYSQSSNVPNEYSSKFVFLNNGQSIKQQLISYSRMNSEQKSQHFENIRAKIQNYVYSSLKQLQRRGELKPFVSHRKGNVSRKDY